jgi:hypothetical protein
MSYQSTYSSTKKRESHSMETTPEYRAWKSMKRRCLNKNTADYPYYGGRGITVAQEWSDSFLTFFNELGKKPFPEYTLDRINPNKGYEPGNCRWATRRRQSINQRVRSNSKSGLKCVHATASGKWQALTTNLGKTIYLGQFDTPEEASAAYQKFAKENYANVI